ncbi:MAG TPA: helix-turn-helix domain-containing protein [Candidatus Saccharimonadales bacterium]
MTGNNENMVDLLIGLGLSRTEAQTYEALLHMDSISIRKIAASTGINRGTTYDALKHLTQLGLVSVKQGSSGREGYVAESPEIIYEMIREKRRDLLDAANMAKKLVPELLAQSNTAEGRPLVRYYEDDGGVVTILKDVLQTCRDMNTPAYYAYSSSRIRQYVYRKFPLFTKRRIDEGIHVKVIAVGKGGEVAEKSERKWLPESPGDDTSSYTLIYGNKVATISIADDDTPYGVVIEDAGVAAMQRLLFERLWSLLK